MFKEVQLPEVITEDINKSRPHNSSDNIFNVSELSNNCLLRMYLDRREPTDVSERGKWAMYRGRIFDQYLTKLFDEDQIRVTHKVPGTNYVIRGKIDAITYKTNELVELKTVEFMDYMKEPRDSHKKQALFYLSCYDPLATLQVLYVGMGGWKNYQFTGTKTELNAVMKEFDTKAKLLGDSLKNNEPPEGMSCKECDWCSHRPLKKCPIKKPKQKREKKRFKKKV